MATGFGETREKLAATALTTDRLALERRWGVKPKEEKKIDPETLKRFWDFVKERAKDTSGSDEEAKRATGEFDVDSKGRRLILPITSVRYNTFEYTSEEDADAAEIIVGAGEAKTDVLNMFTDGEGGIGYYIGDSNVAMEADDAVVNGALDVLEELEAFGKITPTSPK